MAVVQNKKSQAKKPAKGKSPAKGARKTKRKEVEEVPDKHPGGRPRVFDTENELLAAIDEYFQYIKGDFEMRAVKDDQGNVISEVQVWTRDPEAKSITGLALFLGFESRQSIYDYEKNGKFSYIIKRAKLAVEAGYEQALHGKAYAGAIFALKQFGWTDKQEIESTNINLNSEVIVTDDEAVRIKKALESKY